MQFKSSIARAAMTALFIGASAQATILNEYSTVAAWNAAVTSGSAVTQAFTSASGSSTTSGGLTFGNVTYAGFYNENSSGGYATQVWTNPSAGYATPSDGAYIMGGSVGSSYAAGNGTNNTGIRATLNSLSGITALAFNFSAYRFTTSGNPIYSTGGTPILLNLDILENSVVTGSRTLTVPTGSIGLGFFGFTTDGNITGIKLTLMAPVGTEYNRVVLDNFAYATAAGGQTGGTGGGEIPEPTTYLLCAAGLLGIALSRKSHSLKI